MDILYEYSDNLLKQVDDTFFRFLMDKINWNQRMLAIKGPRGTGKTTLMLQYMRYRLECDPQEALYVTADHYWFYTHNLVETADTFNKNGGRYLFIDEVHKYPRWSRELKNIYDGYPDLRVVFSSSSALDIYRGESDLSRRVISYELPGLSFREFLAMEGYKVKSAIPIDSIAEYNYKSVDSILNEIEHPLPLFRKYLQYGYFPFYKNDEKTETLIRISQMINVVIDTDLIYTGAYTASISFQVKKLLGIIAESVPFKPNISAIARKLNVSRENIYSWFTQLEKGRLLNLLQAKGKGISLLQKPDKIFLENTNLSYALKSNPDIGTLRETFLLSMLRNAGLEVQLPKYGDFYVKEKDLYIEVGGKGKSASQVNNNKNYLVAADNIEMGFGRKVPLWLFGFLY